VVVHPTLHLNDPISMLLQRILRCAFARKRSHLRSHSCHAPLQMNRRVQRATLSRVLWFTPGGTISLTFFSRFLIVNQPCEHARLTALITMQLCGSFGCARFWQDFEGFRPVSRSLRKRTVYNLIFSAPNFEDFNLGFQRHSSFYVARR